ncbi:g589 [Coccomyxa viridis]|uniref:G589 protein n=1 Tax=Coccomyxa viridis TaxID=1274662 RepID=A0ABP1FLE7_9CHLO
MGRQEDVKIQLERITPSKVAELIHSPEVLVAHHKHLNDNDWIKVGPFEDAHRRVAYITPWECSSKRLKRLVPYDLLKIVEKQHLQLIRDDSGAVVEAVLTTQPSIASVPVMGTISMGTVVIHVCSEPGFDGCVAHMHLDCSAKGLGWLWSVKSFVEETMLINARRVALHCVEFIADVAKGTPSAAGLLEEVGKGKWSAPLDVEADAGFALAGSEEACDSARSRGCEEVTQRSLSHVSIASAASEASTYFDAEENLPDSTSSIKTGTTEMHEVTSRLRRGSSFSLKAESAQSRAAAVPAPNTCAAKGKEDFSGQGESRSDLLLRSQGRLNPTLEALHQTLHRIQQDIDIIREQTNATNTLQWQTFTQGALLGASAGAAAAWLMWHASRFRQ